MQREAFMARLRARLADPAPPAVAHPPRPAPAAVPPVGFAPDPRPREERFAAALAAVDARLVSVSELPDALAALDVRTAIVATDGLPLPPHIERLPFERAAEADAGLTAALAACATTGTMLAAAAPDEPRGASVLPRVHVVAVPRAALLDTPGDVLRHLDRWFPHGPPSAFALITGPGRSADVEGDIVLGVHGPLAVLVVLV